MFIVRLETYLERWMKLSETPQTYDGLRDLCIRKQFLDVSPVDLSTYLHESKLPTMDEVAQSVDLWLTARKRQLSCVSLCTCACAECLSLCLAEGVGKVCVRCA